MHCCFTTFLNPPAGLHKVLLNRIPGLGRSFQAQPPSPVAAFWTNPEREIPIPKLTHDNDILSDSTLIMASEEDHSYHPKPAVTEALKGAAVTGTGGFLFAAIQNTLSRQNYGAFGVFTRYGGTFATFSMCTKGKMSLSSWLTTEQRPSEEFSSLSR